jgi:hypothetical protein
MAGLQAGELVGVAEGGCVAWILERSVIHLPSGEGGHMICTT